MHSDRWLTTEELSRACGISEQAARKAVRLALSGRPWRGHQLKARRALGRGGRSGLVYEVELESLPSEAIARATAEDGDSSPTLPLAASGHSELALSRLEILEQVLAERTDSPRRARALEEAAISAGKSTRTLYRWLARYEHHGVRGLARARPRNAGKRRVWVSRPFDRAWRTKGYSEPQLRELASDLGRTLKGLWASRAEQAGGTEIRRLAEFLLLEMCEARGVVLPADAFRISRRMVDRFASYRVVNQRRNDRKAFEDAKPRIRRDWTALEPMERVVADVKHLDVIVSRADGSPAWPKIVAFMDAGTGRVFVHPVLLARGEGVRQEHVIEAFLAMVSDPAWGFPQGLYLDNGSEFGALARIDGALQLLNEAGARTIIYAKPYNAAAKPIESLFARLDRYVFSLLPGYAGPNRMAKKTQTVGKPPKPYPHDWDHFCITVKELIRAHNHRPVGGAWRNHSPEAWLRAKIEEGWRPSAVDPAALDAAFADPDSRRIDRGVVKIRGLRYTHPDLAALPSRTIVDLALPWRRGALPLARLSDRWVYLAPEQSYPAKWVEGAREARQRQSSNAAYVSRLAREAPAFDPVAAKLRWSERQSSAAVVPMLPGLDLGSEINARASAIKIAAQRPPEPDSSELRRARAMALTEFLEREQGRSG